MSDFTDARTAYLANADYAETGSAVKAAAFVTACRKLIVLLPTATQEGESSSGFGGNLSQLRAEIDKAEGWLAANSTAPSVGGVVHASFENFRDY